MRYRLTEASVFRAVCAWVGAQHRYAVALYVPPPSYYAPMPQDDPTAPDYWAASPPPPPVKRWRVRQFRPAEAVGQRVAAAIAGLADAKQIGRYAREGGPEPHGATERRLREGYKVVRMLVDAYDAKRARAWLFGTNTRLEDRAPIEVLGEAVDTAAFVMVVRAARQVASFQA